MTESDVNQALIESVAPLPPDLAGELQYIHRNVDKIIKTLVSVAVLNVIFIIFAAIFFSPLMAGKIVVIEAMLALSAVCLVIFAGQKKIMVILTQAEEIAYVVRDQAFVDLNMARDELRNLRHKLRRDTDEEGYAHANELLKMVSPLVMMFIQKEKNILRWGMFGWKVAQNAMAIIKQRSKES